MDAKYLQRVAALAIALAAVALHWPPAETDFNVDDHGFIVENESIRDMGSAAQALLRSFPPAENGRGLYRPLTNFGHALEWSSFELDSRGYHAVNALLYGIVCTLLFALLRWYRIGLGAAVGAAALFAMHPVHTEAVDAIAGRSELLSLGFSLAALVAFARALIPPGSSEPRETLHGGWFTLACLALIGALGSKETGAITAGLMGTQLVIAHGAATTRLSWRRATLDLLPVLLILFAWALLRTSVLGRFSPVLNTRFFEFATPGERLFSMASIYLEYVRLIVWPNVLQPDFYYLGAVGVARSFDARVAAGGSLALATLAAAGWTAVRLLRSAAPDPRSPVAAGTLGATAFFAYLLPVSHVVEVGALMAERFLFSPSFGLALIVGAILSPLLDARRSRAARYGTGVAIVCLCIAGGIRSNSRAAQWRSAQGLWSSYTAAAPNDARGWSSLAAVQLDRGEVALARPSLERALWLDPDGYPQQINNASLLIHEERYTEADAAYRKMIATWPRVDQRVWIGLAKLDARAGRLYEARRSAIHALDLHPNFAETHQLIERIDSLIRKHETARSE